MSVDCRLGGAMAGRRHPLCRLSSLCLLALAIAHYASSVAQARALDTVRFSRSGVATTIEVELGCAMRYRSHQPVNHGGELRIQLSRGQDCHQALRGIRGDLRRPLGRQLADLHEIELLTGQREDVTLVMRFNSHVSVDVSQTSNVYLLTVVVRPGIGAPLLAAPLPSVPTAESAPRPTTPPVERRGPSRPVTQLPPVERDRYVVRIADDAELSAGAHAALLPYRSRTLYTNDLVVGDRRWQELCLGFFDSEDEAAKVLAELQTTLPSSWIAVATIEEQALARDRQIQWTAVVPDRPVAADRAVEALSAESISMRMADARKAMQRRDFTTSIDIYSQLLQQPAGAHRREMQEILGVALEKNGNTAGARAQYAAYLEEFPAGDEANRVRQRLAALTLPTRIVADRQREPAGSTVLETRDAWDAYGSASQYYLRGVSLAQDDAADYVAQSAVLSQAQFFVRRRGKRFDIASRANLSYLHDLVENGSGSQALIADSYVDVTDTKYDVTARVGRQRQQTGGVLGRFDGIRASYRWRPDLTMHVSAGFPVDSPRFRATADHYFYGASVDLANILQRLDLSVFANLQTVDGISDRQAVGAEAHYRTRRLNLVGLLDFDTSYNIVNTGLLNGNWRVNERLTMYGQLRGGVAPFLTTRNAIIGQPVNTVRELFTTYTEGQIRRLARNRTADERAGSAGLSTVLTPRLQLQADFAYREYSATVASGGIVAYSGTGPQYSYGGHLLGTGFLQPGQVLLLGYRHDEAPSIDADTVFVDTRFAIGERFRIQSRLDVSLRVANQNPAGNVDHWIVRPVLRMQYGTQRRYRVEIEAGGQWSNREFPAVLAPPLLTDNTLEQSDYYLQVGYSLDF